MVGVCPRRVRAGDLNLKQCNPDGIVNRWGPLFSTDLCIAMHRLLSPDAGREARNPNELQVGGSLIRVPSEM
jgi:hypothetical protein